MHLILNPKTLKYEFHQSPYLLLQTRQMKFDTREYQLLIIGHEQPLPSFFTKLNAVHPLVIRHLFLQLSKS